jgi:hypothetical protein
VPELETDLSDGIEPAVRHFYENRIRWLMERAELSRREAGLVGHPINTALIRKAESYEKDAQYFRTLLSQRPN